MMVRKRTIGRVITADGDDQDRRFLSFRHLPKIVSLCIVHIVTNCSISNNYVIANCPQSVPVEEF